MDKKTIKLELDLVEMDDLYYGLDLFNRIIETLTEFDDDQGWRALSSVITQVRRQIEMTY